MDKKLIYIMNHYSSNSVQHFYHILNLLSSMADKGVEIALVIEKCEDIPDIKHKNIKVICQKQVTNYKRTFELFKILRKLIKQGYSKTFVRISLNSSIISILTNRIYGGTSYYWQSGTTLEVDQDKGVFKKVKWYFFSYSKLWFVKTFVNNFVTGPETMVDYYINKLKVKPSKMLLLYNDIDIKRFNVPTKDEKEKLREKMNIGVNEKIILMVHRLSPVRKTDKYIPNIFEDSFFVEENAKLIVIGEGPEGKILDKKIKKSKFGNRIELLGAKPNNEIDNFYKVADVFINPSYTEGFPRVVIEAMACGLPVIATDAGGTIDIFGNMQQKYIVKREDPTMFKEKLKEVTGDAELRSQLSKENLSRVKRFSTETVSDMYIERIFS